MPDARGEEVAVVQVVVEATEEGDQLVIHDVVAVLDDRGRIHHNTIDAEQVGRKAGLLEKRVLGVRSAVRVAGRQIDIAGHRNDRGRIVQIALSDQARLVPVRETQQALTLADLRREVVGDERLGVGLSQIVPEIDVGREALQEWEVVRALQVADAAPGGALAQGPVQAPHGVARRRAGRRPVPVPSRVGRIEYRLRRRHRDGVAEHIAGLELLGRAGPAHVGLDNQVVVQEELLVTHAQGEPLRRAAPDDAVLVEIAHREPVVAALPHPGDDHVVLLAEAAAIDEVEPVGIRVAQAGASRRRLRVHRRPELTRVEHAREPGDRRGRHARADLDLRSVLPGLLGGYEHDAVGGVRPVDRRGRGVLQHRDALDVVGIEEVQGVTAEGVPARRERAGDRHSIDHVQRVAARVDRGCAANPNPETTTGFVVVHDLHARHLALDERLRGDNATGMELRRRNLRDGAGDVPRALRSVTGDHDFRQADGLSVQRQVDDDRVAARDRDGLGRRGVADDPRPQRLRARGHAGDQVATVGLGLRGPAPDRDGDRGDRLLRRVVGDASADCARGLLRAELGRTHQATGERENGMTT